MNFKWKNTTRGLEKDLTLDEGYPVLDRSGFNIPDSDHISQRGPQQDGATFVATYFLPRVCWFDIKIIASSLSDFQTRMGDLALLFNPKDDGYLEVTNDASEIYVLYARLYGPLQIERIRGTTADMRVTLIADDPLFYGVPQTILFDTNASGGDDLVLPFDIPFHLEPGFTMVVNNPGHFESWPTITINGTVVSPRAVNLTTDKAIENDGTITSPRILTWNAALRTAELDNGTSQFQFVTGDFWSLVPGDNELQFLVNGAAGDMTGSVSFTPRYLAVL